MKNYNIFTTPPIKFLTTAGIIINGFGLAAGDHIVKFESTYFHSRDLNLEGLGVSVLAFCVYGINKNWRFRK